MPAKSEGDETVVMGRCTFNAPNPTFASTREDDWCGRFEKSVEFCAAYWRGEISVEGEQFKVIQMGSPVSENDPLKPF